MLWCVAPVAPPKASLRIEDVRHLVEQANAETRLDHKDIAAAMGFDYDRISLYYRQLRQHGLNLNLLLNVERRWWLAFLPKLSRLLGITDEQIAEAYGIAFMTEAELTQERAERDARDRAVEQRLRRLERLAGVPTSDTNTPADDESADDDSACEATRLGPGRGECRDVECVDGRADTEAGDRRPV